MRKNGVNRELREISGGICAPDGFQANGVSCGFADSGKKDLALIMADKRCSVACVYALNAQQSATAAITKKHVKNGIAQAILVNSGKANLYVEDGEKLAEKACRLLAQDAKIDATDVVIASTGKVGEELLLTPFSDGMYALCKGLNRAEEGSLAAAQAIADTEDGAKQFSFAFDLGDIPCKIGGIYKGNMHVCPNMATTLVFITTDVNIAPEFLQKALSAATRDSMNMLCVDGVSSPNDTVCIMANGKAGNYRISGEDTEYEKFVYMLREVLIWVCRRIAQDGDANERVFTCKVAGVKSKQVARDGAKRLASSLQVKDMLINGYVNAESIIYMLAEVTEELRFQSIRIFLASKSEKVVVFEDGTEFSIAQEKLESLLSGEEIQLGVELGCGNYGATAFGCLSPKFIKLKATIEKNA